MEKNCKISFFKNLWTEPEVVDLTYMLGAMKEGAYKAQIERLNSCKKDSEEFRELKRQLPLFTPSGTFKERRRAESIAEYNSIVVLDIDKIGPDAMFVRDNAARINTTLAAFISPSGQGVKILVNTDATVENHKEAFNQIAEYYRNELGVGIDPSGKDVSRACFVSHDPDLYLNENATPFEIKIGADEKLNCSKTAVTIGLDDFRYIVDFTDKVNTYIPGNRNNYIHLLACNFNRAGIDQTFAESFIYSSYPEMQTEIPNAVKSAYKYTDEHGIFPLEYMESVRSVSSATCVNGNFTDKTPFIPETVHKNLPKILKDSVNAFDSSREKDIFLTGALTVLSGCFSNLKGVYDKREFYPNLNSFVIAPPASGKGVLNYSRELAELTT